jgi:hypothetical protein
MLMSIIHQIRIALFLFWPPWITMTAVAAICVAWAVGSRAVQVPPKQSLGLASTARQWKYDTVTSLALVALFLAGYIAMILVWETFAYHDNSIFTLYTLRGQDIGPPIMPAVGRFFPLGFQEFNLLRHFTDTITGYHGLRIAQLLTFSSILLILDEDLHIGARSALVFVALITPSILTSFSWLIYHEANVLLFLVCLMVSVQRFEQNQSVKWAIFAVVSAQIMIYYKETASLLLLGFAASRLALRFRQIYYARVGYYCVFDREGRLDFAFIILGGLFWLYYVAVMLPHPNIEYAHEHRQPLEKIVLGYIEVDLLAWLLVGTVLIRIYLIVRREVTPSPLWDGLAIGAVACFAGYLGLGMFAVYYLAPVDLIAVLYMGRLAVLSVGKRSLWGKLTILILVSAIVIQDVALSAFRIFEQKSVVHVKGQIAKVVQAQYRYSAGHPQKLFFPFANPYMIMEFAAYLSYLGVPIEGASNGPGKTNDMMMAARTTTADGPCISYRKFICHAATMPDPGDLVIILPDDNPSLAEVALYREKADILFSHVTHVPKCLYPFIRILRIASPGPPVQKDLPDGWLYGSASAWK